MNEATADVFVTCGSSALPGAELSMAGVFNFLMFNGLIFNGLIFNGL